MLKFIFLFSLLLPTTIAVKKSSWSKPRITVLSVFKDRFEEYRLAMETFECYCLHEGYKWVAIDVSQNKTLQLLCPQDHIYFQRHCVVAQFMEENDFDYLLYADSDIGIINPKRRIEEYIMPDKDIVFYYRTWNVEIMAATYLAKNTVFVRNFLRLIANYNFNLPKSFYGSDNVAIHTVMLHVTSLDTKYCEPLWNNSKSFNDLFIYESCILEQLETNQQWKERIAVLPRGKGWARDGWITESEWSKRDFMFHGWQKRRMNSPEFASWKMPFLSTEIDLSLCNGTDYLKNWKYNTTFMKDDGEIEKKLQKIISKTEQGYEEKKKLAKDELRKIALGNSFFATAASTTPQLHKT